jgi:hypothetical protein
LFLDFGEKLSQRRFVGGVARHHFVSQGESLGRDDQSDHDLAAVGAMIAAVAELRLGNCRRLALDLRAGQVVAQHFVASPEQILPARLQVREQRGAMFQQTVQHEVKLVFAAPLKMGAEQIAHRTAVIPLAMTAPLAARRNEPVGGRNLEPARPIGALARGGKFLGPKLIQAQLPPQLTRQPTSAILAWMAQVILIQAQRQRGRVGRRRRAVGRKQTADFGLTRIGIEHFQRFGPGGVLRIVEIPQIQEGLLMNRAGGVPNVFDDARVAVFLAIFFSVWSRGETYRLEHATGGGVERKGAGLHDNHFGVFDGWKTVAFLGNSQIAPANFFENPAQYRKLG